MSTDTTTDKRQLATGKRQLSDERLLKESQRIPFSGLTATDSNSLPTDFLSNNNLIDPDEAVSFKEVISALPEASTGQLQSVNELVNKDGSVDAEAIRSIDGLDVDALDVAPENIINASRRDDVTDYVDIVDMRRKALAALGYNTKYRWQIPTTSYSIINPVDAYGPAKRSFHDRGEGNHIFGWVDLNDYGGDVDCYFLFEDQRVEQPDDDDADLYIGIHTGYDFSGGRTLSSRLFGYDPERNVRFYSLGPKRSRRHVGKATDARHERRNDRTPIQEWWEEEHERILSFTDEMVDRIRKATKTTINFSKRDYSIEEFYRHLDIDETYAQAAAKRAKRHSPDTDVMTIWTLFISLTWTLENDFQGEDYAGNSYRIKAEIATSLLTSPVKQIDLIEAEHHNTVASDPETVTPGLDRSQMALLGSNEIDVNQIDGISTEDELGLAGKRQIVEDKQKSVLQY